MSIDMMSHRQQRQDNNDDDSARVSIDSRHTHKLLIHTMKSNNSKFKCECKPIPDGIKVDSPQIQISF